MRSAGSPTLTPRDDLAAVPGARLYLVEDGDRMLGSVASHEPGVWWSGRVGPLRSRPWLPVGRDATRRAAVARLAGAS